MKKILKIAGIVVAVFVAIIIGIAVWGIASSDSFQSFPEYKVRSEEYFETNAKARIDIELTRKEPEAELLRIAKVYRDKYKDSRSVWIWYYVPGSEDCYATSHYTPDGFEGVVFQNPVD